MDKNYVNLKRKLFLCLCRTATVFPEMCSVATPFPKIFKDSVGDGGFLNFDSRSSRKGRTKGSVLQSLPWHTQRVFVNTVLLVSYS